MKKLSFALAAILAVSTAFTACGGEAAPSGDTTAAGETDAAVTTEPAYDYPALDCGGEEFHILNGSTTWGFYHYIDHETQTGDLLDDAVYIRNRGLEERCNFKLKVTEYDIAKLTEPIRQSLMAGDNEWDVVFNAATYNGSLVTEGMYYNLYDIPEFRLEEPWWEQSVIEEATIGDAIYFAMTDFTLFGIESAWCVFFNEDMLADLKLDRPYQLVRDGKWTIDALRTYAKAGMNLNGDDSYAWNLEGNCIYGLTSSNAFSHTLIISIGERYISRDKDGNFSFTLETDRFYDFVDAWTAFSGSEGEFMSQNNGAKGHYEDIFKAGRALFMGAELKAAQKYRDLDASFGIVPTPKLDESQKEYNSSISKAAPVMCVPVTNPKPERAGIIMDALTYESYENILPIFYDVTLSQKGLRNDESIEMLQIVRDTRFFDLGDAYGWTTKVQNSVRNALDKGDAGVASLIAAEKPAIEAAIKATMDLLK